MISLVSEFWRKWHVRLKQMTSSPQSWQQFDTPPRIHTQNWMMSLSVFISRRAKTDYWLVRLLYHQMCVFVLIAKAEVVMSFVLISSACPSSFRPWKARFTQSLHPPFLSVFIFLSVYVYFCLRLCVLTHTVLLSHCVELTHHCWMNSDIRRAQRPQLLHSLKLVSCLF